MYWIESIGRDTHGFVLETVAPQKGRNSLPLKHLAEPLELGRPSRIRLTTDCANWSRESGAAIWEELGIGKHCPKDGHAIFRFSHDGKQYLLPASTPSNGNWSLAWHQAHCLTYRSLMRFI